MSQTATEIERMTISLENLDLRTAILSSQLFERILDTLERMTERTGADARTLNQLWDQLQRDFRQLTNRYQDYLRDFYSSHARHILQTTEFLPYKDKVVRYLQEFVLELQRYAEKIRRMLLGLPPEQVETMLQQVYAMQLQEGEGRLIQRSEDYPRQLREEIYGFWQGFYRWFVPGESRQSDSEHVLELANDIIQRILMNAELILQTHSGGANRKVEYKNSWSCLPPVPLWPMAGGFPAWCSAPSGRCISPASSRKISTRRAAAMTDNPFSTSYATAGGPAVPRGRKVSLRTKAWRRLPRSRLTCNRRRSCRPGWSG